MGSFSIWHWLIVLIMFSPVILGFAIMGPQKSVMVKHGASGLVKKGYFGYCWTYLLFGWLVPIIRGEIGVGVLHLILTAVTFGLFQIVMPFLYNKQHMTRLLTSGWQLNDEPSLPVVAQHNPRLTKASPSTPELRHAKPAVATPPHTHTNTIFSDESLWAQALAEFEGQSRRPGLWARSFSEARGDEAAAKASYLGARVLELEGERQAAIAEQERLARLHEEREQRACSIDEQLIDLLCKQILENSFNPKIKSTLERLGIQGFDIETIEMLVADRLGPEGSEKLSFHLSR